MLFLFRLPFQICFVFVEGVWWLLSAIVHAFHGAKHEYDWGG
jgi:hypothetical protein